MRPGKEIRTDFPLEKNPQSKVVDARSKENMFFVCIKNKMYLMIMLGQRLGQIHVLIKTVNKIKFNHKNITNVRLCIRHKKKEFYRFHS